MICSRCGAIISDNEVCYCNYPLPGEKKLGSSLEPVATLRDQFAMAALTGILCTNPEGHSLDAAMILAKAAYSVADAMMEARGK